MLTKLRKSFTAKVISLFLLLTIITQWIAPLKVYALTSGPTQPEVHGFEPIGTSDMVDLFSGDFNYNIPLMDVDGYPINLSYHSGVSMDQEASWVGLGWSLNPGVVNRNIRGIPDDFSEADKITQETNVRPDQTFRVDLGMNGEVVELPFALNVGLGIYYNNYKGMGYSLTAGANIDVGPMNLGAQLGFDTESGIDFNPSLSLSANTKAKTHSDKSISSGSIKGGVSMGFNSRGGLKEITFSASYRTTNFDDAASYAAEEANGRGKDINGSSSISFANPTYSPNVQPGSYQYAFTLSGKFGGAVWAVDPSFTFSVNYSEHGVQTKTKDYSAYGYIYADKGAQDEWGMQDVTREKEGGFNKFKKYLPVSSHAYDVYSVSGQGTGGVIRPHRGNIGTIFDARAENENWPSVNISIEAGGGPPPSGKIGGNIKVAWSDVYSGIWRDQNNSLSNLTFQSESSNSLFEAVYFKNSGEKSTNDFTFFNKYGGEKAVRVALDNSTADARALPFFISNDNHVYAITSPISRSTTRDKRNMCVSYLTADVANSYAVDKYIRNYTRNGTSGGPEYDGNQMLEYTTMGRMDDGRKPNHISELTSLNPDGTRYIYGIPAYNHVQLEKSFNVNNAPVSCNTGLVNYASGDNTLGNTKGIDHYYSGTSTPPFAHSYLLTAVLSPDYIDIQGDGPSDDDFGKYTRFNYSCVNTKADPYMWRTPFYDANHNEGLKSDKSSWEASYNQQDDKGSYLYGEKEVWHLSSIETKNYIAEFYTSPRSDAKGVSSEDQDSTDALGDPSFKLDSIRLMSKHDILENGSGALPIKVVHFEYNYDLCQGSFNSSDANKGKLTLESIWFTYGNSSRGSLSKYEFNYGNTSDPDENPDYSMKSYDRWGNYKPNSTNCSNLQNADFPYVDQDKDAQVDEWAAAWHLKSITLPSGGEITINYESDDYAYVQNREAMQMIKILGFDHDTIYSGGFTRDNSLFTTSGLDITSKRFVYFKAPEHFPNNLRSTVKNMYFRDMDVLYYNFLTKLTGYNDAASEKSDYVAGYCEIDSVGYVNDSIGYIAIKQVPMGDRESIDNLFKIHPASKASLQYIRVNRSDLAYPPEQPNFEPSIFDIVGVVFQFFAELKTMILGFNRDRMLDGYAKEVDLQKSWIRLCEPSYHKKGGGSRVNKIEFADGWDMMTGSTETDASYGQEYKYEMEENGIIKSSGVASYEPALGGDENPWKKPIKYEEEIAGAPNNDYYVETPIGESYFPGASVGYRRVEVINLKRNGVHRHLTGKMVHEFYTAAEFPTITRATDIQTEMHKPWSPLSFMGIFSEEYATASQGYCIELNDMHGKPKAQWTYSELDDLVPISGVEYKYKVENDATVSDLKNNETKLNNTVTVLLPNGTYTQKIVGEEIDMVVDANEKKEDNYVVGAQVNVDGFMIAIIPIVLPIVLPEFSYSTTRIKTIVATKVINRAGILEKTIAHDNGATLETQNVAWDAQTGEVLLTRVQNEYRDNTYNLTYPVHWAYDRGMGQAYKNINTKLSFSLSSTGKVINNSVSNIVVPGDELAILNPNGLAINSEKLWVLDVKGDTVSLIYRNGRSPLYISGSSTNNFVCRIIRSGRRNMQTLPLMTLSTRSTPLYSGRYEHTGYDTADVLNSSAAEYSQDWQAYRLVCDADTATVDTLMVMASLHQPYYVDLVNELFNQNRFFTGGVDELFWDYNFWSIGLLSNGSITSSVLSLTDSVEYSTDTTSGYIGATQYPGIEFRVDLNGASITAEWCTEYNVYSTKPVSEVGSDFYDDIDYIIPSATYSSGVTVPAGISALDPGTTTNTFYLTARMKDGTDLILYITGLNCDAITTRLTDEVSTSRFICCPTDSVANPYIWNLRGNWRLYRNFVYFDKRDTFSQRTQAITAFNYNTTYTREDGLLASYIPLWYLSGATWTQGSYNTATSPWTWQTLISQHSPYMELENKDALNIYSAALLGYNFTLPTAVAKNAMLRQIAYDGFEDYLLTVPDGCILQDHFNFKGQFGSAAALETTIVHTGKYSLRVDNGENIAVTKNIDTTSYTTWVPGPLITTFKVKRQHLISQFEPLGVGTYNYGNVVAKSIDGKYILSYWVSASSIHTIPTNLIAIKINGSTTLTLTNTGNDQVVENWKRIERSFTIPSGTTSIEVKLNNTHSAYIYYDDIRIQPLKSSMISYVYDIITQRLTAQLDDNNYATFYEYDEQGNLVRIKKETERGVMTIQESRQNTSN